MFLVGALMLVFAGAFGFFFGFSTAFGPALARILPGIIASTQNAVIRVAGSGLWYNLINPIMEAPCWAPFASIGALFVLFGVLRRV